MDQIRNLICLLATIEVFWYWIQLPDRLAEIALLALLVWVSPGKNDFLGLLSEG